jgi:hypothetical protein
MAWAPRCLATACLLSVVLAAAGVAEAAGDTKVRCAAAYEQSQELRRQDKLSAARSQLLLCEQTCPRALATDCKRWGSEVDALLPTVRLHATDGQGHAVDARVLVDGTLLVERLPDASVQVDTGDHRFRFESATGLTDEVRVSLHGGERDREIAAVLAPAAFPPAALSPPPTPRPIPPATYALGGLGVAGLGLGLALAIDGHVNASHLQSTCSPACAPSRVDAIGTVYDVAWVSAGVGVAAIAGALLWWRPWQKTASSTATTVFVAPTVGGLRLESVIRW